MHATHGGAALGIVGRDAYFYPPAVTGAAAVVTTITGSTQNARELFVGRDEQITQLLNLLAPSGRWPGTIAVSGMGGLGKTALASHTASAAADRGWFPGGVLFVNLRGYELDDQQVMPGRVFASMLRILDPDGQVPATVDEQAAAYHLALNRLATQERRVLLVLDNAAASTQVTDLLPRQGPHRALITSRDTLALPSARQFVLDVLRADDALRLLVGGLARRCYDDRRAELELDAAERLAVTVCGALPLAVEITTAVLADEPGLSIADLIAELTAADGNGVHRLSDGERIVATAIDQSWHRLRARHTDAAQLLPLLTINPGPDFHTDAAAALAGRPAAITVAWLRTLRHASLLRRTENGRWTMHDLIRSHAREHLHHTDTTNQSAATHRLLEHYANTTAAAEDHLQGLPGQPVPERFAGQVEALAWLNAERANLTAAVDLALTAHQFALTTRLASSLGPYLNWRRHLNDWLITSQHALTAAQHLDDPQALGIGWNDLGNALQELRRFDDAITAHQTARDISQELGNRHLEGMAWDALGSALGSSQRFDDAITAHQTARDIFQKLGNRHREGMAWNNLGNALQDLKRFDDAITAHQTARNVYQELGDRRREASAWHNLGLALHELRRFDDAITAYQTARDISQELGNRHLEGMAWDALGRTLRKLRRFDDALTAHQTARDIYQQLNDHHGEGMTWRNTAITLRNLGHIEEAKASGAEALRAFRIAGDLHAEKYVKKWLDKLH
ncbi:tetratricopeptide repeat protein [Amycolatopsis orientalis]|uniref:tetratricopeptide repeat protein n=1 Tax=Amycolatopsis orientalis TaxID=31958 RepID=UPI0004247508|nr:tetratricopeptide repeat protein [Amycolatopsis orientalis]